MLSATATKKSGNLKLSKNTLWLDRALFVSPYYYRLCLTDAEFQKELKYLKVPRKDWPNFLGSATANATIHFFESPTDGLSAIICITVGKQHNLEQVYAMLVHEAVHLFQEIKLCTGEAKPSVEFEAYAIQTLSQRLMESYKEQTSKKGKK